MKNLYGVNGSHIAPYVYLEEIVIPEDNPYLVAAENGVVYSADMTQLIFCPSTLKELDIPDTVTSIEAWAMLGFSGTALELPVGLVKIGDHALYSSELRSIHIPASVKFIESYAFATISYWDANTKTTVYCLEEVTFAAGSQLESIGGSAFAYAAITSIALPDTVVEFGTSVFQDCKKLVSVDMPSGIKTIGTDTFKNCYALKDLVLHEGLESIYDCFDGCSSLESIVIPASVTNMYTTFLGMFRNCTSLKSVIFAKGSKLTELTASSSSSLFVGCPKIEELVLPASLSDLIPNLFDSGDSLKSITILGDVETIPDGMFRGFKNLVTVNLPDTVKVIGANAFDGCTSLVNINLPASLTTVGEAAFRGCTALESVLLGDSVESIGNYAFDGCTALSSVIFGENNAMTALGTDSETEAAIFRNTTALKSIALPDGIQILGKSVFQNSGIETVSLPESLVELGDYAFSGCASLTAITLPESVKVINDYAFENCSNVKTIELGMGVETFGTAIFMNCVSLESVNIPATVNTMVGNPFINCPSLAELDFNDQNPNFKMQDGALFNADKTNLIFYQPTNTAETFTVPSTVIEFAAGAFYGAQLKTFVIPDSMKTIPDLLFYDAKNLTSITIPLSVTSIGEKAFMGCTSLASVNIKETVTSIGAYAFANCTALSEVTFNERNTNYAIGAHAFEGCIAMTELELPLGLTTLTPYAFANTGLVTFTVPETVTNASAEGVFANNSSLVSIVMPDDVGTVLGKKFFMNCTALTSFTMPSSVTDLCDQKFVFIIGPDKSYDGTYDTSSESYTFAGCTSLESVDLVNASLLGAHLFEGCTSLTDVTFPADLAFIGDYAFAGCTSLEVIDFYDAASIQYQDWTANPFIYFYNCYIDIGYYAFKDCTSLTEVYTSYDTGIIYDGAFEGCTALTGLEIEDVMHGFYGSPFRGWTSEQRIYFPIYSAADVFEMFYTDNEDKPEFLKFFDDTGAIFEGGDGSLLLPDKTVLGSNIVLPGNISIDASGYVEIDGSYKFFTNGKIRFPYWDEIAADGTISLETDVTVNPDGSWIAKDGTVNPAGTPYEENDGWVLYTLTADGILTLDMFDYGGDIITYDLKTKEIRVSMRVENEDGSISIVPFFNRSADGTFTFFVPAATVNATDVIYGGITIPKGTYNVTLGCGSIVYLNGAVILADGTTIAADGTVTFAEGVDALPEGITVEGGVVTFADGTTLSNGTITLASGTVIHPDGSFTFPEAEA
jgi:hypothetical protein